MKKLLLLASLLIFAFSTLSFSQCTIDSIQTAPGVHPDTLPLATAQQFYSTDVTFVLITDTMGFTITNFQINSITGLPIGMTWVCNNIANGCNYDPSVSLYGCVNLSGTPLLPGTYTPTVTVTATLQIVGDQIINYSLPLIVQPGVVTNPGFNMTNATGCAPLTVSFQNNNPGQSAYLWDFGNGLQSTLENPPAQTYTVPGDYIITQTVTPNITPDYYLTQITVNSIPDNYGAPIDVPDMYLLITDGGGATVFDSHPSISNTNAPYTWAIPNILLQNQNYTVHVWDEDGGLFGADDDLGLISFAGWGTSGNATATVSGATGTLNLDYTIFQTPIVPLTAVDTVHVYPAPTVPTITSSGPLAYCAVDSILLSSSALSGNQWFLNGLALTGDTLQNLTPFTSGDYTVAEINSFGCSAMSSIATVTIYPIPAQPGVFIIGDTLSTNSTGFNLQWNLAGVPVVGLTQQSIVPLVSGYYSVTATDANGCSSTSDSIYYSITGINNTGVDFNSIQITPLYAQNKILISFYSSVNLNSQIALYDISGRNIVMIEPNLQASKNQLYLSVPNLQNGVYLIEVNIKNSILTKRFAWIKN